MSWRETLVDLDNAVMDKVVTPYDELNTYISDFEEKLKDLSKEVQDKFEEVTALMLDAMREFATGTIDEPHLKIALNRYKTILWNYGDAARIELVKSAGESLEKKLLNYLPALIKMIA